MNYKLLGGQREGLMGEPIEELVGDGYWSESIAVFDEHSKLATFVDADDNCVKQTNPLGRSRSFTYDKAGNRSHTSSASLSYDDAGRKVSESITYPSGSTLAYQYSYSLAGKKTRLTWPDGSAIDYGYSAHGELETVTIPGEGAISVSEYAWNAPKKTLLPGGGVQNRTFDGLLNLENLNTKTPGQQTTLNLDNRFGKLQEINNRSRTDTSNYLSTTKTEQFSFDADNRLTQVQSDTSGLFGTDTENFTLDAVGNRIAHSKVTGAWAYDANNRLTQIGSGSCGQSGVTCYQYDSAGNLTQKQTATQTRRYGYDTQNRLSQVTDASNNLIARYGYDPLNRRIWKEQFRSQDGQPLTQAQRTHYLYADEGLIAEATQAITLNQDGSTSSNGAAQITSQYGPKPESQFTTGMLFIKTKNSNGQDTVAYYHHDHLATPIQATDKAGNIVWAASYQAFGKASITTPQATADKPTITSNLRLPGQYEDAETGLHYNWHRYYDNETGRYTQSDPIGLEGGINLYAYVGGNPLMFTDPTGLICEYSQSGRTFTCTNAAGQTYASCTGYSGNGQGLNNPAAQNQPNVGPLPQGSYTVGGTTNRRGPNTRPLIPDPSNNMYGRAGFLLHGDNAAFNNTASEGCIIIPPQCRTAVPVGETLVVRP